MNNFDFDAFLKTSMQLPPVEPTEDEFVALCQNFRHQYEQLPNLLVISHPVTIVGNIHAQLDDLHEMFDTCGHPPYTSYLFLGDFVGYGDRNISTVSLLFSLALKYPDYFYLLRGSHESHEMTVACGLYVEFLNAYGSPRAWESLMCAFNALPLAAHVCNQFFCVSGGIDRSITKLSQINDFNRFIEVPTTDSWSSLVWSIPNPNVRDFTPIENGHGFYYGKEQLETFLKANNLSCLVHSKQLCKTGYSVDLFDGQCICIWSAPNFCGWMQNEAAVLQIVSQTAEFKHTFIFNTFRAKPECERISENRPPIQDIHILDHAYIKSFK